MFQSNHCSAAAIMPSSLVTVLLSELVCNTRVISPNDASAFHTSGQVSVADMSVERIVWAEKADNLAREVGWGSQSNKRAQVRPQQLEPEGKRTL